MRVCRWVGLLSTDYLTMMEVEWEAKHQVIEPD